MTTLDALIEALGKASGPDRELDEKIVTAIFDVEWKPYRPRARTLWGFKRDTDNVLFYGKDSIPKLTASIDAAVTLVPEGLHWSLNDRSDARVGGPMNDYMIKGGEHKIPAIALLIAICKALRARAIADEPASVK